MFNKNILANFGICLASLVFCLIIAEGALRLFKKENVIHDPVLLYRLPPSGEIDRNGFRNPRVLSNYDIVALGDSQTYGARALSQETWPSQLGTMSDLKVYNMGIGGYGPVQYWYLLDQAISFHPKVIIWGLYLGNDLFDAYSLPYEEDPTGYWKNLKNLEFAIKLSHLNLKPFRIDTLVPAEKASQINNTSILLKMRYLLGAHSAVYAFVSDRTYYLRRKFGLIIPYDEIKTKSDRKWASENPELGCSFDDANIGTVFTTAYRDNVLNLDDPRIAEGLRITLNLIAEAHIKLKQQNILFLVVLIPTKESAYASLVKERGTPSGGAYLRLLRNEARVKNKIQAFCREKEIYCLDPLPHLQMKLQEGAPLYASNNDGHPRAGGYAAIASGIHKFMQENHLAN